MPKNRILITGANGQIGSVLTKVLRQTHGVNQVIATDIRAPEHSEGPFELLNVLEREHLFKFCQENQIHQIYHLAAILSAKGEQAPLATWDINMQGLFNVLEAARLASVDRIFFPSSIAVFGPETPKKNTPQNALLCPTTVYGISKVAGENWCRYYFDRYGVDVRSLRYPGIIGYQSMPGGGTTDYAVDIFHYAVKGEPYTCFLKEDTGLPMIYMDDAIRATIELMEAPKASIRIRSSYNLAGMSFTPRELAASIQSHLPEFSIRYEPDFRQAIADSWNESIDDSRARTDWGWQPRYDRSRMTQEMIQQLSRQYDLLRENG